MLTSPGDYMAEVKAKRHVVGTWGFNSRMDFTRMKPEETNVWFFEQVFNFLRAFFGLVMPDNMEIITYNATQHIKKERLDQQTFLDELMLVMKGLKEQIWTFRLNLNIVGFIRSQGDPDNPVRVQIQEPSSFIAWGGPDETGFQNFSISYNLFSDSSLRGSNEMLWSVNQPLLEKGLRKWEIQTGHMIDAVQSNAGKGTAVRHGFKRPLPTRPRPPGPPPAPGIARPMTSSPPPGTTKPSAKPMTAPQAPPPPPRPRPPAVSVTPTAKVPATPQTVKPNSKVPPPKK